MPFFCFVFLFFLSFSAQTPLVVIKLKLRRVETASWHFTCLYGYRQLWTLLTTSWGRKLSNPGKTWIPQNKVTPPRCCWIHWRRGRLSLPRIWSSRRLWKCLRRTSVSSFFCRYETGETSHAHFFFMMQMAPFFPPPFAASFLSC